MYQWTRSFMQGTPPMDLIKNGWGVWFFFASHETEHEIKGMAIGGKKEKMAGDNNTTYLFVLT